MLSPLSLHAIAAILYVLQGQQMLQPTSRMLVYGLLDNPLVCLIVEP
jgi:hypothetical protein